MRENHTRTKTKTTAYVSQSIRFSLPLWKKLKAEADKKGLSVSDIVRLSCMEVLGGAGGEKKTED